MTKRNKIIYWVTTGFGFWHVVTRRASNISYKRVLNIIGVWKILGVIAILIPRFKLVKEWAYAGFFFVMSGATFSHNASGDFVNQIAPSLVLLILIVVSWYFRPADRKIILVNQ